MKNIKNKNNNYKIIYLLLFTNISYLHADPTTGQAAMAMKVFGSMVGPACNLKNLTGAMLTFGALGTLYFGRKKIKKSSNIRSLDEQIEDIKIKMFKIKENQIIIAEHQVKEEYDTKEEEIDQLLKELNENKKVSLEKKLNALLKKNTEYQSLLQNLEELTKERNITEETPIIPYLSLPWLFSPSSEESTQEL